MVNYSTQMGSYSTTDGELQQNKWVKKNAGNAVGRYKDFLGKN
jgi:hypothetical protein